MAKRPFPQCIDCNKNLKRRYSTGKRCHSCAQSFRRNKGFSTEDRFWSRVDKNGPIVPYVGTPCWIWIKVYPYSRYGSFGANGKNYLAHRFSYQLHYGDIPNDLQVCHKCDNPFCVRPDHLFAGTQSDNIKDMYSKGRAAKNPKPRDQACVPRGEKHHATQLTAEKVIYIRKLREDGMTYPEIARRVNVRREVVGHVVRRKVWKHI